MTFPTPNDPPKSIGELVDQVVDVTRVEEVDGDPVVEIEGAWYMCSREWSSKGARYIQAELAANGVDKVTTKVVEHPQHGYLFISPDESLDEPATSS